MKYTGDLGGTLANTSDTSSTTSNTSTGGTGGNGGNGGSSGSGGGLPTIDSNALQNDPWYQIQKAYIDATGSLDSSTLQQMISIAQSKYGLSAKQIQEALADTQRNITYDLANRQATESGDNAFYHGRASQMANDQMQSAQLDLQDYLAGVQAAYAQRELDRQYQTQNDLYQAYQNEVNYYTTIAGGGVAPPPFPGTGTTPSG